MFFIHIFVIKVLFEIDSRSNDLRSPGIRRGKARTEVCGKQIGRVCEIL